MDAFGDTLDLVPIAAWKGQGKRHDVYGSFLCASYNSLSGKYETVCKIGGGFSDEKLKNSTKYLKVSWWSLLKPQTADDDVDFRALIPDNYIVEENSSMPLPDVWLEPRVVWGSEGCRAVVISCAYSWADIIHEKRGIGCDFLDLFASE